MDVMQEHVLACTRERPIAAATTEATVLGKYMTTKIINQNQNNGCRALALKKNLKKARSCESEVVADFAPV